MSPTLTSPLPARAHPSASTPRIALVFDWFWSYAAPQAVALHRAGAHVALVCRTHAKEFDGLVEDRWRFIEEVTQAGVEVFEVPGRFSSVRALPDVIDVARRLRRWAPDLVHAHDNYDPRLYLISHGYPTVLTVHDPSPHLGAADIRGARRAVRNAWLARASVVIVHGEPLRAQLASGRLRARIEIVPHGTSVSLEPLPVPAEPRVLLFGRLEPYKGISVLLEAMELVWRRRDDIRMTVAGRGPEARLLPADPRIEVLARYVPEDELDSVFARATLAVLPYIEASQSGAGLQALGRGVPLVVTDAGALHELVHRPDMVVPAGGPARLADAVLQFIDHDERFRSEVLEDVRARFSWEAVAARSLAVYDGILRTGVPH